MKKIYTQERVRTLSEITARHAAREIQGCTSWRHYAVHQDRAWLLNAIGKIRDQVEKVRLAGSKAGTKSSIEPEVRQLIALFEEETLNHLGDDIK